MVMCALQDPETYIHRSGRTGRAGSTGVSVTLVDRKKEGLIPYIQKKAGVNFERIGAPQPAQMAQIAGTPTSRCLVYQQGVPHLSKKKRQYLCWQTAILLAEMPMWSNMGCEVMSWQALCHWLWHPLQSCSTC